MCLALFAVGENLIRSNDRVVRRMLSIAMYVRIDGLAGSHVEPCFALNRTYIVTGKRSTQYVVPRSEETSTWRDGD